MGQFECKNINNDGGDHEDQAVKRLANYWRVYEGASWGRATSRSYHPRVNQGNLTN